MFVIHQFMLGWKTYTLVNIIMQPTNSPTQEKLGQKNEVEFGSLFPTENDFSWVGIGFI